MATRLRTHVAFYRSLILVLACVIIFLLFIKFNGQVNSAAPHSTSATSGFVSTSSSVTTTIAATQRNASNLTNESSGEIIKEVIYSKKTVTVPAPQYNLYYNYVIGCYYIYGAYFFSFNAPYAGYIAFNETNTGIPNNYSVDYFAAYISRQKPIYFKPQPYNDTSFCPGWDFLSTIDPWTAIVTYNNQTVYVPIKNGTNYIIFSNGNANQQHGINPFPINVTFSLTYYGFKGITIPNPPNTTSAIPNSIPWGKYT